MAIRRYPLIINPQQWEVGPLSVGRRRGGGYIPHMGRNQELAAYQSAVHDALMQFFEYGQYEPGPVQLHFWFWRRLDTYHNGNRQITKNAVDATNMQKALEDALQGAFFENDRQVINIHSEIVAQGVDVEPAIIFEIRTGDDVEMPDPDILTTYRQLIEVTKEETKQAIYRNVNGPEAEWW
jgi:Holliday junction resolvase RusA-like endonuclease